MNSDIIKAQAMEILVKEKKHLEVMEKENMLWKLTERYGHLSQVDSEGVQQHLISSVIFRLVRRPGQDL